jgi:hypothetical protein
VIKQWIVAIRSILGNQWVDVCPRSLLLSDTVDWTSFSFLKLDWLDYFILSYCCIVRRYKFSMCRLFRNWWFCDAWMALTRPYRYIFCQMQRAIIFSCAPKVPQPSVAPSYKLIIWSIRVGNDLHILVALVMYECWWSSSNYNFHPCRHVMLFHRRAWLFVIFLFDFFCGGRRSHKNKLCSVLWNKYILRNKVFH